MTTPEHDAGDADDLVTHYLVRLARAAGDLPAGAREELLGQRGRGPAPS